MWFKQKWSKRPSAESAWRSLHVSSRVHQIWPCMASKCKLSSQETQKGDKDSMIRLITLAAATRDNIPDNEAAALRSRGGRYVKQHNWAWCCITITASSVIGWKSPLGFLPWLAMTGSSRERGREREEVSGLCAARLRRFLSAHPRKGSFVSSS